MRTVWTRRLSVTVVVLAAAGYGVAQAAVERAGQAGGALTTPAVRPQSLTVATNAGQVFGRTTGLVDEFLGMPYAAPPVGRLRWQPPQPVRPWAGIRSALSYGNRCAQLPSTNGPRSDALDCLTVNVYEPAVIPAGGKLPVLFMINGGDLENGAGDQHDGSLLAQQDQMIVVSFDYRLGPFGFLTLPGLTAARSAVNGNFGLLDMEAALRWVRRNIAAFGGNRAGNLGRVHLAGFGLTAPLGHDHEAVTVLAGSREGRHPVAADHRVGLLRCRLDVLRVVVPPVDDDQVLEPAGDQQLALVKHPGVAGAEPALTRQAARVGGEHRAEGLRAVLPEVAGRDVRPADPDLTDPPRRAYRAGLRMHDGHVLVGGGAAGGHRHRPCAVRVAGRRDRNGFPALQRGPVERDGPGGRRVPPAATYRVASASP